MHGHDHENPNGHGHSLAEDWPLMRHQLERRRALRWFAGAGAAAMVAGCGDGETGSTSAGAATGTTTAGTTTTGGTTGGTTTTGTTTTGTTGTACIVDPTETAGPYPGDGTNTSSGSTSNVLIASGIVRSDIRSSFLTTSTVAAGVAMRLTLTVVNVNATCAPLAGYAVYLWHADRNGNYSLYSGAAGESYLRGVQVTDANGQVTFTTIFPACYDGRWPHMHFEVFSSLSNATSGRYAVLTSQLAMPADASAAVFADTATYPNSLSRLARVSVSSDGIFGDNTAAQIAQQTPVLTGSPSAGYTATALIGIAR